MMISIVTPCSRVHNLPAILRSIENGNGIFEWVIVYDKKFFSAPDTRVLMYSNETVAIKLLLGDNPSADDGVAWRLRNIGIDNATGDYICFIDDDNILHNGLYYEVSKNNSSVLVVNQYSTTGTLRLRQNGRYDFIDTAQIVVRNGLRSRWDKSVRCREEEVYFNNLVNEVGENNIAYSKIPASYYNYLRKQ